MPQLPTGLVIGAMTGLCAAGESFQPHFRTASFAVQCWLALIVLIGSKDDPTCSLCCVQHAVHALLLGHSCSPHHWLLLFSQQQQMRRAYEERLASQSLQQAADDMQRLDIDGDGLIDFSEFSKGYKAPHYLPL